MRGAAARSLDLRLWLPDVGSRLRLCPAPAGKVRAAASPVDRRQLGYAGGLPPEATARLIPQGIGGRGSCRQYLENTVCELRKLGLVDGPLHRLEQIVKAMAARERPCG